MNTVDLVRNALKEQNPALYSSLQHSGKLNEFLDERTEEIKDVVHNRGYEIARSQGYNKLLETDPIQAVGVMNMALALAREEVFAEMLEFPQDETSPSRPDETTPSAMPI